MQRFCGGSVFPVAGYRMTHVGGVHPDLILPAGFQFEFYQRIISGPDDPVVRDGVSASVVGPARTDFHRLGVVPEITRDGAFALPGYAFKHRHIFTLQDDPVPIILERIFCFRVFCEDYHS